MTPVRVAVVGAGMSGLALAHRLCAHTPPGGAPSRLQVQVFEAAPAAGGHACTLHEDGFLIEAGPNAFLERVPDVRELATELGLEDTLIEARSSAARRFIVRGGRLRRVPQSPATLLAGDALSVPGRLRVLLEPWARPAPRGVEETVHEFARRRIGREAADVLVDTAVSGISAGDARALSVSAAFPMMVDLERDHGSLIRAFLARRRAGLKPPRLLSFRDGVGSLPAAVARALGPRLHVSTKVARIERAAGFWRLMTEDGRTFDADRVVLALPARRTAELARSVDPDLARPLSAIPHSSVAVVALAYRERDLPRPLDGYGFLVARSENDPTLGVVWESSVFEGRAPSGHALVRAILGGPLHPGTLDLPAGAREAIARAGIARWLGVTAEPVRTWHFGWRDAIPQYTRGHAERVAAARERAAALPGLELCGTAYDGVSFGSAVASGRALADRMLATLGAPDSFGAGGNEGAGAIVMETA